MAFSTDSYVVQPAFFPGGNIGKLAVCGTVNDLAMNGAIPQYLSCGLILEEGLAFEELDEILRTMSEMAKAWFMLTEYPKLLDYFRRLSWI